MTPVTDDVASKWLVTRVLPDGREFSVSVDGNKVAVTVINSVGLTGPQRRALHDVVGTVEALAIALATTSKRAAQEVSAGDSSEDHNPSCLHHHCIQRNRRANR
jgi:hypothetical protein